MNWFFLKKKSKRYLNALKEWRKSYIKMYNAEWALYKDCKNINCLSCQNLIVLEQLSNVLMTTDSAAQGFFESKDWIGVHSQYLRAEREINAYIDFVDQTTLLVSNLVEAMNLEFSRNQKDK